MKSAFLAMCSDDPACAVNLPAWRARLATWTYPEDSGTCVTWMTGTVIDVDAAHPMPGKYTETGKPQSWSELVEGAVQLPAKISYAPMKTFVQSFCHDEKECGTAGNWQGTLNSVDSSLKTQAAKVSALGVVKVAPPKKTN